MLRFAGLVFRNALRNRRRSLLTILSIGASFTLFGVLFAMYHLFFLTPAAPGQELRLITRNRISLTNVIPMSYRHRIRQVPGVREVMPLDWFGGTYKDSRDMKNYFARFAVEPDKLLAIYPEYKVDPEEMKTFGRERNACIVGRPLAGRLGFKPGDHIQLTGDIFPVTLDLVVRGFYDAPRDNENLYFQLEYLNQALPARAFWRDVTEMFTIAADKPENVPAIANAVDDLFRNSTSETKTESEKAFELTFLSYIGDVKMFLLSICGALTFTVLLVSANTMAMSVRERVREVGILKTLGYTIEQILGMLLAEAVMISLAGALVGLAIAFGIVQFLRTLPIIFVDLKAIALPPWALITAITLAIVVGMGSAFVPAWTTSRRPIVACLAMND